MDEHTHIDAHTRTGVRWVTAHSTHTHAHKYINMQSVPLSACNCWQRGHSRYKKITTIEDRMNQRHHGEHAVAEWRTKNQKKKKKKKRGEGGTSLSTLWTNQRGEGFLSHAMQEGGGSPFACRWGMSQSVHAYMSVTEWWGEKKR